MTKAELILYRLVNQQIAQTALTSPQQMLSWMVAMQAQEYAMAKWAIGLRLNGLKDADIEEDFNAGRILRTHLMRPTWHFVTPADIGWLTDLTAPRIRALMSYYDRELELDTKIFTRCNDLIAKTLEGGKQLTRVAIGTALADSGILLNGRQLGHVMMQAEQDKVVCSGGRAGKQFTYALFDERVPMTAAIDRDEALSLLCHRYFSSRGPATAKDFSVWSGLTLTDAKKGIATLNTSDFLTLDFEGSSYILPAEGVEKAVALRGTRLQKSFLMPDYDEYGMAYIDRTAIFNPVKLTDRFKRDNPVFDRMVIIDGIIEGTWRRTVKAKSVAIETFPFPGMNKQKLAAMARAVEKFRAFVSTF